MNTQKIIKKTLVKLAKKPILLFKDLTLKDKVEKLSNFPYLKGKYYHVTAKKNYSEIISQGVKGEEIWVSKDKPVQDYNSGILLELDLTAFNPKPDDRWKKRDQVYVITEDIPSHNILRVFDYFEKLDLREDILAKDLHGKSSDFIRRFIEENNL